MRTETTTCEIFTFDELSDSAKETARDMWRESGLDYDWWCYVYSDAYECAAIIGVDIDKINFSGFCSQGDGARFIGKYAYKKASTLAIRAYAPQYTDLHSIADNLQAIQKAAFYRLYAHTSYSGFYEHSGCMAVSVDRDSSNYQDMTSEQESQVTNLLREFADWIYSRLSSEYDWLMSNENIDESILVNEYEFDAIGRMV